ncbi:MAG: anion transporter [Candidatus Micrarchaeota archaeon]|nr:anion transporter [Candidatus Micrarchaeota archaeon]
MFQLPPLSVLILIGTFILVAIRQIGRFRLQIWQIVLIGAVLVLLTGQISIAAAVSYIDPTVIVFLIGIFIVGEALTESGYMRSLVYRLFRRARSVDALVLLILFSMGFASMFLLNDTVAVIGTPVVMLFAIREHINPKLMLLSLAFAVTIGSAMSPIGNPQNILIASSGIVGNPFASFFSYLALPTAINFIIAYLVLRFFYKNEFNGRQLIHAHMGIRDRELARLCRMSLALLAIAIVSDIILISSGSMLRPNLAYLAVAAALPILIFSKKRYQIVLDIDWSTIVFFIALFVLVGSVWQSGFLQGFVSGHNIDLQSVPAILMANVIGSQFISNVPMVMIYIKLLSSMHVPVSVGIALAAGSTIAGNLFILGAASNVIILQSAEKRYGQTLSFMDFAKIGSVVTALNVIVYWLFLAL